MKKLASHVYKKFTNNIFVFRIRNFLTKSNNINDFLRRIITLLFKCNISTKFCSNLYDFHYKYINKKLMGLFNLTLNNIKNNRLSKFGGNNNKVIWVFWYQGIFHMPLVVKECLKSIERHSNNHKVIVLNKYNLRHYAKLPKYIYDKVNNKDITLTEFSDILRFNLLRNYGGLWIDSTMFLISDLTDKCFKSLFTDNSKYLMVPHSNMSLGRWTEFFIGGNSQQPLFVFMDEFFQLYWKYNNNLLDYFLADCALHYAYIHNIGGFYNYVKNITPNPFVFKMVKIGNNSCTYNQYKDLINKATYFKLNYKEKIKNVNNSFYYYLFNK